MEAKIAELLDKVEEMDAIIKQIDDGCSLGKFDTEIVRDLLSEYRLIILNTKVKF